MDLKYINLKNAKIRYFDMHPKYSDSSSSPLLLIPGWPISAVSLLRLMEILSNKYNIHCIAINLPGLGGSQFSTSIKIYGIDVFVDILKEFINIYFQGQNINIFGYSLGGFMSISYLLSDDYVRINKIVAVAPPLNPNSLYERLENSLFVGSIKILNQLGYLRSIFNTRFFRSMLTFVASRTFYTRYLKVKDKVENGNEFMNYIIQESKKIDLYSMIEFLKDFIELDYTLLLKSIRKPILLIGMENDHIVFPYELIEFSKLSPNILFKEVKQTGHEAIFTKYQDLANIVGPFLSN